MRLAAVASTTDAAHGYLTEVAAAGGIQAQQRARAVTGSVPRLFSRVCDESLPPTPGGLGADGITTEASS